jgi:hypothetical protein
VKRLSGYSVGGATTPFSGYFRRLGGAVPGVAGTKVVSPFGKREESAMSAKWIRWTVALVAAACATGLAPAASAQPTSERPAFPVPVAPGHHFIVVATPCGPGGGKVVSPVTGEIKLVEYRGGIKDVVYGVGAVDAGAKPGTYAVSASCGGKERTAPLTVAAEAEGGTR